MSRLHSFSHLHEILLGEKLTFVQQRKKIVLLKAVVVQAVIFYNVLHPSSGHIQNDTVSSLAKRWLLTKLCVLDSRSLKSLYLLWLPPPLLPGGCSVSDSSIPPFICTQTHLCTHTPKDPLLPLPRRGRKTSAV